MRLRAGQKVDRGFDCPNCEESDAFIATTALGDYVELNQTICPSCGYQLSKEEIERMETTAFENAADDLIGEYGDWLRERDE